MKDISQDDFLVQDKGNADISIPLPALQSAAGSDNMHDKSLDICRNTTRNRHPEFIAMFISNPNALL